MSLIQMWSYGEVLLPLPDTSRRIDIRDGSPPTDQVKYVQKCGGLDLSNGSSLLWRNDDNKLELIQFHPQEQGLNESVTIAFPRNVQVLPSVAMYETKKKAVLMVIASQASLHLVTLTPLTEHHSILGDLTASDFKRACFPFKSSIPVTFCDTIIHDNKGLLFISSKTSSPTVICISASNPQTPETLELKSTGLLGRLWNSNSEANRSKAVHFALTNGQLSMLSITADNQLRIWSSTGECLFTGVLQELVDYDGDVEMDVKSSDSKELFIFVKARGNIFKYRLSDDKRQPLTLMQDFGAPNNGLINNFNCETGNVWIVMKEETENGSNTSVKAFDDFRVVDLSPSQSPEEYVECKPHEEIPRMVLQTSTIMPSALRRALAGKAFDAVPEHITQKYVQSFLANEARHEGVSQEEYFAEFYDTVLEYNERALAITGVVGGQLGRLMILRRNAVGFIRPLTQVEAICAGLEPESSGLDLSEEAGDILSSLIPVFNEIVANSDVMELVSFRLRNGECPLTVAQELREEMAALITESERKEDLDYQISNMAKELSRKTTDERMDNVFTAVFGELVRLIEVPQFSEELEFGSSSSHAEVEKYHLLASTTRSIGHNLFTLAQLGLVLVDNLVSKYNYRELVSVTEAFADIVSNLVTLDWVSSARSVTKSRGARSDMNFTSGTRLGDTFSSFSMNASTTIFESSVPSESQLLEGWLAMGGIEQIDAILSSPNIEALGVEENNLLGQVFAIVRLLSISNERMSLPIFLLETGQYDLLKKWVRLNKYVTSDRISVVNYFEGICMMQDDSVDEAVHHFMTAATNLHKQDFFTKYLLKDLPNSTQPILTTSLFLHVAEKFKENTSFCRQILEVAVERIDQDDDRQSQLWNKVFKLRLQDEDYTGAYRAMISNTDIDSQKNCLRTFVLHLSDSGDFGPLVNSEYSGLESEIAPILENRALAVSPDDTRYFDLLYAFLTVRENYRGAARAKYLQSQHIASGYETLEQLETREAALLIGINSLYLVRKEDQWVATASMNGVPCPVKSPKRTHEGGMRVPLCKDTVVTSLADMENECLLVQARLSLKMDDIDTAGLDAAEVASLMAKQGMYTEAGNLLKAFKEPADVAVKILASSYACNISRPEAEGLEMQLIDLIEEFELGANSTRLYYIASEEILKIGQMIPPIMLENYRERDATELVRQMAKYGELDEAIDGACFILEKAQTLLERKKSLDGFWLPTNLIEQLNSFAKLHNHELHELLQKRMDGFLQILENSVRQNVNAN